MPESSTPTLITTPFGFASTAAELVDGIDLAGKHAIVTGGASGIGVETARALAGAGARVTLAVRRTGDGEKIAADIRSSTGNDAVAVAPLELTDFASIAAFVAAWDRPLDILVNNAGVMAIQELTLTDRGQELQFATNHLGHFALTVGLHDALAAAGNARIVSVSSSGHLRSPVIFDDLDYAFRDYDPFGAYGQSKTANVLFAVEATRRWAQDGITANALMPDGIATELQRHVGGAEYMEQARAVQAGGKRSEDGRAGGGDLGAACQLSTAGGNRRALLRGLQRGPGHSQARRGRRRRRGPLCPRCQQRRAALGGLARVDRLAVVPSRVRQ
jgi:NAD(P)-dependent dehydrogenase (short-subunit alcohol dehydrogenase family)